MKRWHLQVLRVLLCCLSIALVIAESRFWWIGVAPWVVLCVHGIILTIPVVFLIGMGAGAAQADWMSDGFIFTLLFVLPTIFSMFVSQILTLVLKRFSKTPEDYSLSKKDSSFSK